MSRHILTRDGRTIYYGNLEPITKMTKIIAKKAFTKLGKQPNRYFRELLDHDS